MDEINVISGALEMTSKTGEATRRAGQQAAGLTAVMRGLGAQLTRHVIAGTAAPASLGAQLTWHVIAGTAAPTSSLTAPSLLLPCLPDSTRCEMILSLTCRRCRSPQGHDAHWQGDHDQR